jgi:hypothetical protein
VPWLGQDKTASLRTFGPGPAGESVGHDSNPAAPGRPRGPLDRLRALYEGAAAKALDGADISFFIGLPVAGVLYYFFCRSVDVAAETRVAEAEAAALEEAL